MQAENQTEWELTEMLTAKELLGRAQALEPQLVEWRRTLHRHPEVGFDLTQTKALVKKALTEMGYEPKNCGKAGVIALAGGKKPGKTILLRADMDALPIPEDSGEEFSSEVKKLTSKPPTRSGLSICRSGSGRQSVSGPWQDNACCCRWL